MLGYPGHTQAYGETSYPHTQLTPKAAKIYKPLALGQFFPQQFPTPQLPGALPCLLKFNSGGCSPTPSFTSAQRDLRGQGLSDKERSWKNEEYPVSTPERAMECLGETRALSKAQEPQQGLRDVGLSRSNRVSSRLVLIVRTPLHLSASRPPASLPKPGEPDAS